MKSILIKVFLLSSFFNLVTPYASPIENNWNYINDFSNNSLGGFLQRENVNDCFEEYGPVNVAKLQCYLYNSTFHIKEFFCLFLSDGAICL